MEIKITERNNKQNNIMTSIDVFVNCASSWQKGATMPNHVFFRKRLHLLVRPVGTFVGAGCGAAVTVPNETIHKFTAKRKSKN